MLNDAVLLNEIISRGYAEQRTDLEVAIDMLLSNVGDIDPDWQDWPYPRKVVAAKQTICLLFFKEKKLDVAVGKIDGLMGHLTENAIETFERVSAGGQAYTRPKESLKPSSNVATYNINQERRRLLPHQSEMMQYYGNVGTNQVEIRLPYPMRLDWDTSSVVNKMTVHAKAADDFSEAFETILDAYGAKELRALGLDLWGGTLNVRKMRGGTAWSMHSWGCAIDFCTERNGLRTKWESALFSQPDYIPFVNAWLSMGWVSLGLEANMDAMHFQRARIR